MSGVSYQQLRTWATSNKLGQHPSELHGLVTGWVCAGAGWSASQRRATFSDWLSLPLDDSASEMLEQVYAEAAAGLVDDDFAFRLLLPDDSEGLDDRTEAVCLWCSGFLSGFGMTGHYQDTDLSDDMKEVLSDLSRISSFSDDLEEDDDNESDLIEISEYVRMSALLVFTECAHRAVH